MSHLIFTSSFLDVLVKLTGAKGIRILTMVWFFRRDINFWKPSEHCILTLLVFTWIHCTGYGCTVIFCCAHLHSVHCVCHADISRHWLVPSLWNDVRNHSGVISFTSSESSELMNSVSINTLIYSNPTFRVQGWHFCSFMAFSPVSSKTLNVVYLC